MLTLALAAAIVAVAAAPAHAAVGSAEDEYTLDLPGDNGRSAAVEGATPGGPDAAEGGPQAGVTGEAEEAISPLAAAMQSPLAPTVLTVLLATLTFGLLMGTVRPGPTKQ